MKDSETRRLETFIRVRQYVTAHAASFPEGSRGRELLAELEAVIADLERHTTAQASGARAAREKSALKSSARISLHEDLEALRKTARAMERAVPGAGDKFRLPRNAGDQEWLAAARAAVQNAATLKDEFTRRGLPTNFLEHLSADIAAFEQSINNSAQTNGERVAATAAIDAAIERGADAVRELDAVVRNTFRDDAAALAEWTSASHVERAARGGQADAGGKNVSAPTAGDTHVAPPSA